MEYVILRNEKAPNKVVSKTVERERERERGGEGGRERKGNLRNAGVNRTISNWFSGSINRIVY